LIPLKIKKGAQQRQLLRNLSFKQRLLLARRRVRTMLL
jgi:hypothetical protein